MCAYSNKGSKYSIVSTDDFTGVMFFYFLKKKSDAANTTLQFIANIAPYGKTPRLRSDTEYSCWKF